MIITNVTIDKDSFVYRLNQFDTKAPIIAKKMMTAVNTKIKADARKEMRSRGWSSDHTIKALKSFATKEFSAKIFIKKSNYWAGFIEHGARPRPRTEKYLHFKVNNEWKKVKSTVIPAQPFLKPAVEQWYTTNKASNLMNLVLQKELDKLFENAK